ncbi:NUDIX domain-containing protein [uncultured Croceitalea sp.]|uniref:NUDIX hydrolase n=1 Tax=uncultured Croceitalea sp. TaxID=1798908 RepID=UPI0033062D42
MDATDFLENGHLLFLPNISIDIVILGFQDGDLKVLLQEFDEQWCLPGGYIFKEESLADAAHRVLYDRTGIEQPFLKLFQVFGDKDRSFALEFKKLLEKSRLHWHPDLWVNQRFVTMAHYALVNISEVEPTRGVLDLSHNWFSVDKLPTMLMDHGDIVAASKHQLRRDITLEHISFNLLPEEFTMPELQRLHETILGRKLERSRFQKKMLSFDVFERLPQLKEDAPRRKPYLYRFKESD